eukprot:TRINITY_DN1365_c0_g2_i1.p1 TRINITY_DN1365_c0_g2~~TRINITY_DN1365_c0_g2_i1.p1  ORF type:complete len:610 (+),score=205.28 TRINITY_DN1365_c0_g2_i1:229-1830(+)
MDVGNFRDVWCGLIFLMCMAVVVGMGGYRLSTGEVYLVSKGTTVWTNRINAQCTSSSGDLVVTDTDSDAKCRLHGAYYQAVACDDDDIFISETFSTEKLCKDAISTIGDLKDNIHTAKISKNNLGVCVPTSGWGGFSGVTLTSSTCTRSWDFATNGLKFVFIGAVYSFVFSVCALILCKTHPVGTIWGSNIVAIALYLILAMYFATIQAILPAVLLGVVALLLALFLYLAKDRIPFAAECLRCACTVILTYWGLVVVAFSMLLLQVVFIIFWSASIGSKDQPLVIGGFFIVAAFVFYWGMEVFKNVGHTTTAGVTADWFFSLGGPATPPYFLVRSNTATPAAFKRTVTWSFGSICFGSLVVAILQTIKLICDMATDDQNAVLRCMVLCIIDCLTQLLQYFNDYAYVQVAMFGKSYVGAAKDTWGLIKSGTGWDAIINDALIDRIFLCFAVLGALTCGALCLVLSNINWTWFVVGLVEGFIIVLIFMKLIYSSVMTIFIGFWTVRPHGMWTAPVLAGAHPDEIASTIETKYYHH